MADEREVHIVIETETVIEAVRSHRLLWDPSHEAYATKEVRRHAWADICRTLMPHWDTFDDHDRNDIERKVQQRWRTARDCYVKARAARLSARATKRDKALRSYAHYDRLSFLEETMRAPPTEKRRRRRRSSAAATPPPAPTATATLEPDDEHFFRSLAPMLAALDPSQKLQFRSDVLDVLRRQYRARDHISTYLHYVDVTERRPDTDDDDPPDRKYRPPATPPAPPPPAQGNDD